MQLIGNLRCQPVRRKKKLLLRSFWFAPKCDLSTNRVGNCHVSHDSSKTHFQHARGWEPVDHPSALRGRCVRKLKPDNKLWKYKMWYEFLKRKWWFKCNNYFVILTFRIIFLIVSPWPSAYTYTTALCALTFLHPLLKTPGDRRCNFKPDIQSAAFPSYI